MDADEFGEDEDGEDWSQPADGLNRQGGTDARVSGSATGAVLQPESKLGHERTIIHIDVDCFYAQVEMIRNPSLRDVPLGIQQKYLVVTCNYPARARGVTKLMGIAEAKKKCPELMLVSGEDLTHYREMSYKISEFLVKYTPNVERLGFDENFLDVTDLVDQRFRGQRARREVEGHIYCDSETSKGSNKTTTSECPCGCHFRLAVGSQIAADIRSALSLELGITCCAGIAHNKLLAKLVAGQHKPNQQTTLFPEQALSLLAELSSVRGIPGIGWSSSKQLKSLGVVTVSDLQRFPLSRLEEEFGASVAVTMHQLCFGVDDSPVVAYSRPQTLSNEDSFRRCSSEADARSRICELMDSLLVRVQEDGRTPHTFRVTVRKANKENRYLHRESRQCNVPASIFAKVHSGRLDSAKDTLVTMAMSLFHKMVNVKQPFHLTLINVAFAKLEEPASNSISSFLSSPSKSEQLLSYKQRSRSSEGNVTGSPTASSFLTADETDFEDLKRTCTSVNEENSSETVDTSENASKTSPGFSQSRSSKGAKRQLSQLSDFFTKRPRESSGSDCGSKRQKEVDRGFREEDKLDCLPAPNQGTVSGQINPTAPSTHSSGGCSGVNLAVPSGIDPDVFSQLPPEIQQEILHSSVPSSSQRPSTRTSKCITSEVLVSGNGNKGKTRSAYNESDLQGGSENKDIIGTACGGSVQPVVPQSSKRPLFFSSASPKCKKQKQPSSSPFEENVKSGNRSEMSARSTVGECANENAIEVHDLSDTVVQRTGTKTESRTKSKTQLGRHESTSEKQPAFSSQVSDSTSLHGGDSSQACMQRETHKTLSSVEFVPDSSSPPSSSKCPVFPEKNSIAETDTKNTQTPPNQPSPLENVTSGSSQPSDCIVISDDIEESIECHSKVRKFTPRLQVPKGIASEVFAALPPEIQREVAAEMAIQKHKVPDREDQGSIVKRHGSKVGTVQIQKKGQSVKKPGESPLLKYLKKK